MTTTATTTENLRIGVARADITPPVGIRSAGFAVRGPLTAHHDPLFATTLVAADAGTKAALVTCDLIGVDADTVTEIRQAVQGRTGVASRNVTIACTHTHYGPCFAPKYSGPIEDAYRQDLVQVIAGTVEEAERALQPARIGVGWGTSDIGVNRREKRPDGSIVLGRNPDGAIDRAVGVLRIDSCDGDALACAVNFQAHPVSQQALTSHISADYPGRMRDVTEQLIDAPVLFLQGACGNINAAIMEQSYAPARMLGTRLGCEVARVWETIETEQRIGLQVESCQVNLPQLTYGSEQAAQQLLEQLKEDEARLAEIDPKGGRLRWTRRRMARACKALRSWTDGTPMEPIGAEIQGWRLGQLGIAAVPGEIFNQIGVRVKDDSPFDHTFFLSGCNDSIGYVPVPEAYPEGGYEVMNACRVDPEAAGIITTTCLELLRKM